MKAAQIIIKNLSSKGVIPKAAPTEEYEKTWDALYDAIDDLEESGIFNN